MRGQMKCGVQVVDHPSAHPSGLSGPWGRIGKIQSNQTQRVLNQIHRMQLLCSYSVKILNARLPFATPPRLTFCVHKQWARVRGPFNFKENAESDATLSKYHSSSQHTIAISVDQLGNLVLHGSDPSSSTPKCHSPTNEVSLPLNPPEVLIDVSNIDH